MNQPVITGGKWKALFGSGVWSMMSKGGRSEDVFLKVRKMAKNQTFFGGLSTTATEILFSSCWGDISFQIAWGL